MSGGPINFKINLTETIRDSTEIPRSDDSPKGN